MKIQGSLEQGFLWSHVCCAHQDVGLHIHHRLERSQLLVRQPSLHKGGNSASRSVVTVLPLETYTLRSPMDCQLAQSEGVEQMRSEEVVLL